MSDNLWPLVIILVTVIVFTHHEIIYLKHFQILYWVQWLPSFWDTECTKCFLQASIWCSVRLFHHVHCVHSHIYKSFDKYFFLEGNNLAPGETLFKLSVQNIHRNAVAVILKHTSQKGYVKSVWTTLYVLCVVSCRVTPNWCFRRRRCQHNVYLVEVRTNKYLQLRRKSVQLQNWLLFYCCGIILLHILQWTWYSKSCVVEFTFAQIHNITHVNSEYLKCRFFIIFMAHESDLYVQVWYKLCILYSTGYCYASTG